MLLPKETYSAFRLYMFFISMCVPWELNPWPFALLTQCSTTEPQEQVRQIKFCRSRFECYTKDFHPCQANGGSHVCMNATGSKACSVSFTTESGRRKSARSLLTGQHKRGSNWHLQQQPLKTETYIYSLIKKRGIYSELNESFIQDIWSWISSHSDWQPDTSLRLTRAANEIKAEFCRSRLMPCSNFIPITFLSGTVRHPFSSLLLRNHRKATQEYMQKSVC